MERQEIQLLTSATFSLFQPRREYEKPEIACASRRNLEIKPAPPYNTEISMFTEFVDIISDRDVTLSDTPYWIENATKYNPWEVYASSVQFFDCHNAPLPKTTLPPSEDVQLFINRVLTSDKKLIVSNQFDILLDITDGNVIGAGNIGMIGTRILARCWDSRAYPDITVTSDMISCAGQHLAAFEDGKESLGDTYYFWTNFFATAVYNQLGDKVSNAFNRLFNVGTPIMRYVRQHIVHQPTVSSGCIASDLGRLMGSMMGKYLKEIKDEIQQVLI